MMNRLLSSLLLPLFFFQAAAQQQPLSFQQLFGRESPALFREPPSIEGWADDDHYLEKRSDSSGNEILMAVHVRSGKATPYPPPDTGSRSGKRKGNEKKPATQPASSAEAAKPAVPEIPRAVNTTLSPDGQFAAYTKDNNLFIRELKTGRDTRLTSDGSETILNGYASWVYYEEILGRSSRYKAFWWSPDSRKIAFMRFDNSKVPVFPIYVADGQYGYLENQHYPKAGDINPEVKIGMVSLDQPAAVTWAAFDATRDQYFGTPYWTPGNTLWVQWMNRRQDSLVLYQVDGKSGQASPVYTENQSTWITLDDHDRLMFVAGGKEFILKSDKDGWENLYRYRLDGTLLNRVTTGNFWGTTILQVDEKKQQLYIRARKEHSARFDIYRVSFNGKNITRLSFGDYSHELVELSPGGKHLITLYSNLSDPPAMAVVDNRGKIVREIFDARGEAFNDYALARTRLLRVKSSDGRFDLPLTITYPLNFDSTRKYPVWISVYGGPNATTVYDRWLPAGGARQWWAQEGLVQVSIDNRASGHFGKEGMNYIHRQMGLYEMDDFIDCAEWLKKQTWADSTRIGITGGSFGGYVACMALTYGASTFTHGLSNFPVTDWHLYDTHYTERFMQTPAENPAGYKKTAPVQYADKYRGILRIVHGSTDDNVHMQNSIQLINTLQDMNKHFEMMIYPNQRHGIGGSKGRHQFSETFRFVYRHMLGREMPAEFSRW